MKKEKMKQEGITLVALVVTIVVLLILAGVSLNLVLSDQGIVKKAQEARNNYSNAAKQEAEVLANLEKELDNVPNGGNSLPQTADTKPYLPTGFTQVSGTDLNTGLVVKDVAENEYVWIEVPKSIFTTATSETDYTKITADLRTYTIDYKSATCSDVYYSDGTIDETTGLSSYEYTDLYQKMLKSVYINGGFYIGRYEAGIGTNRISDIGISTPMVTKPNQFPYNYVTCSEAETLAKAVAPSGYNSSLMFGVQWDLVLKYLQTKGAPIAELKTDSSSWGNYSNVTFDVKNGSAQYSTNAGSSWTNAGTYIKPASSILLTTGATTRNSKQNIFDIAGNEYEWTLEYSFLEDTPCVCRGYSYSSGSNSPASYRNFRNAFDSSANFGFRVALY